MFEAIYQYMLRPFHVWKSYFKKVCYIIIIAVFFHFDINNLFALCTFAPLTEACPVTTDIPVFQKINIYLVNNLMFCEYALLPSYVQKGEEPGTLQVVQTRYLRL